MTDDQRELNDRFRALCASAWRSMYSGRKYLDHEGYADCSGHWETAFKRLSEAFTLIGLHPHNMTDGQEL